MKKIIKTQIIILVVALILTSCGGLKDIDSLMGSHGGVYYEHVQIANEYTFADDIFLPDSESGIYAKTEELVKCKVTAVDEVDVSMSMPVEKTLEDENPDDDIPAETITEYYDVTATVQLLTVKIEKNYHGELKSGKEIRIMTRVSSKKWDETAIPLFAGDECVLHLRTAKSDSDIMKIYDRGLAEYYLDDSVNGVIKKTESGWIFNKSQSYLAKNGKAYDLSYNSLSEEVKKCYRNEDSYNSIISDMIISSDIDSGIENNVLYYYENNRKSTSN